MDKATKKRLKQAISWLLLVALVAGLTAMPLLARKEAQSDGPVASILKDTVKSGSIASVLKAGGTLTAGNAMDVKLPSGVKITDFLVKNGDYVTSGTPVATVDKVTLMNAIVKVQESMDYLRDEISNASNDTIKSTISAPAGGYVKKIFAKAGDSVRNVMLQYGALAVLSLDGRMAVKFTGNLPLAAGDTTCVTLSDGTEITGRVESNLDGQIVISVDDKGYEIGEIVTVTTEDGDTLGSGELYVHNVWTATGFSGTIRSVYAKEKTSLSAGASLFTLTDTDFTATRDTLADLHREYEALLQDMFRMYETGVITAPCDGEVSGVDEDSVFLLSALQGQQGWFVDLLSGSSAEAEGKGWTVMLLSSGTACTQDPSKNGCDAQTHLEGCYYHCTGDKTCTAVTHEPECFFYCSKDDACDAPVHQPGCPHYCTNAAGCPGKFHADTCPEKCANSAKCKASLGNHLKTCPKLCTVKAGCTADQHESLCPELCTDSETCQVTIFGNHLESCPQRCQNKTGCTAGFHLDTCPELVYYYYTGFVGVVNTVDTASGALSLMIVQIPGEVSYSNKWDYGTLDVEKASGAVLDKDNVYYYTDGTYAPGDIVVVAYSEDGTYIISNTGNTTLPDTGGLGGLGGLGGMGSFGGMFGFGGMPGMTGAESADAESDLFDLDGDVLMTVTEQDIMTLTITIDEHDIAKVFLGQTAQVDIAALKGQTFAAEVTEISSNGSNNGGSSKFTAELTIPFQKDMLAGMSATATLPLFTKTEALVIPVAALVETESATVVYTALDPETGDPGSPIEVTVGVSDGENAEILSGLNSGDTFYYSYYEAPEPDPNAKAEQKFSFG